MTNQMPCGKENGICQDFNCKHNFFYVGLKLNGSYETEKTKSILNCCCLIDSPWTLEEIGEAWGLTREAIRLQERNAFIHLLVLMKKNRNKGIRDYLLVKDGRGYKQVSLQKIVQKEIELRSKRKP